MIKVKENKTPQHESESIEFLSPKRLYLPLSQHLGKPSDFSTEIGQIVTEGEIIAQASGFISAFLNSPSGGKIKGLEIVAHPVLKRGEAIVFECEAERRQYIERKDTGSLEKTDILDIIKKSGIVGMGGACFPTQVKLSPVKKIDTIIINGCECEPYITSDHRLMLEQGDKIIDGLNDHLLFFIHLLRNKNII